MAQLVARFHGMEEVGGSNPPSSTAGSNAFALEFLLRERLHRPLPVGSARPVCASSVPSPVGSALLGPPPSWAEYNVLVSPCETAGKRLSSVIVGMARNANGRLAGCLKFPRPDGKI